jgi:hypothetical protein
MTVTTRFNGSKPITAAQGRYGEVILVQGGGVRPARWSGVGAAVDAGMNKPVAAPTIALNSLPLYYVARVDVSKPGACYNKPPVVTLSGGAAAVANGGREAKTLAYLSQGGVYEIAVQDGGKGYPEPPSATLSATHGSGANIKATLAGPADPDPKRGSPYTGITQWEIVEQPAGTNPVLNCPSGDVARFAATNCVNIDLPIDGNGTFTVEAGSAYVRKRGALGTIDPCNPPAEFFTQSITYTVSGVTAGTGAVLRLRWDGAVWYNTCAGPLGNGASLWYGATELESAEPHMWGAGYGATEDIRVTIDSIYGEEAQVVIEGYAASNPKNTMSRGHSLAKLDILSGGSGYVVAPAISIASDTGFGAYATCTVAGGAIASVKLENSGGGYRLPPTVTAVSGGAEAFVVARPHLRGKYQCYTRFVDATPEGSGGPIPSSLSPVREVDAGEGARSMTWSVPAVTGRAALVELWRTSSNQATTLYRVTSTSAASFVDSLTDEELRDPDRAGYAAMPIVLPNGEINANRFTPPPSDKAVVVRFQDRFWYGVDTGGAQPNTVLFSEVDEPESVPESNELVIQQNAAQADSLRALIPFGPTLLLMQSRHAYSLSFSKQPVLDAQVAPIAYRGALNQRCWDIHNGVCYVMDQYGVYALAPSGGVEPLSDAIDDIFNDRIDFSKSDWPFVVVDHAASTLRAFVAFKGDDSREEQDGYATKALCYSIASKAWWIESYPTQVRSAAHVRLASGDFRCAYATPHGAFLLDEGAVDVGDGSVESVVLTNRGTGYKLPPVVTATGGVGATFQASVDSSGSLSAVWITNPGFGYAPGSLSISPPDDPNGTQAVATFSVAGEADPMYPTYRFKSGCMAYPSDSDDPKAAAQHPRGVSLLYKPQPSACELSLRTYYNNAPHPRPNVAPRSRGVGFSYDTVDNAARLDMAALTVRYGYDTGVAKAMLAGRTMDDIASADRHVAVEMLGARKNAAPVEFYRLDVEGG